MFTRKEAPSDLQPLLEEARACGESAWLGIQIQMIDYLNAEELGPWGE